MTIDGIVSANGDQSIVGDQIRTVADCPDDPPIIFGWSSMRNLVDLLNDVVAQVNAPAQPFLVPMVGVVDENGLRMALLNVVREPTSALPIGFTCLPCNAAEGLSTSGNIVSMCYHPWFRFQAAAAANTGIAIFPLAELYVPRPRSVVLDRLNARAPIGGLLLWT